MKRFIAIFLSVITLTSFLAFASACMPTDTTATTFEVCDPLPWTTSSLKEKMVFSYQKKTPEKEGSASTIAENGEFILQLDVSADKTVITMTATIYAGETTEKKVCDMYSKVTFASGSTLTPYESYKKITTYNAYDQENWVDYGYEVYANFKEGERSSYGFIGGEEQTAISIPDIGTFTYDNEQLYYVVRCATNLAGEGNSGTFDSVNLADSYFGKKFVKASMIYTVEGTETLDVSPSLEIGDKLPCYRVKLALNANQSGPGIYLYYSANDQAFGEGAGKRVLTKITREQYNVTTFEKTYIHEYNLIQYSVN